MLLWLASAAGAVGSWVFWGPQGSKYSRRRGTQLSSGGWEENAHAFSLCLGGTFNFILLLNLIRKENKELWTKSFRNNLYTKT